MALSFKEKELVAVGASVAAGCKPCTNYHFKKVREADASNEEIKQAISDAMCVRASAKKIMEAHGLKHLGIVNNIDECGCSETTRIKEMVFVAAAFAVNCTSNLEKHITAARNVGISDDELKSVLNMTSFIKGKAASHVERILENIGRDASSAEKAEDSGECGCDTESEKTGNGLNKKADTAKAPNEESDCGCSGDC